MALSNETIQAIIDIKQDDENNRNNVRFKGMLLSNRDVAEQVLGSRSAESTVRRVWKKYHKHGHYNGTVGNTPIAGGSVDAPAASRKVAKGKKFVITSAQNNTHIHEDFFNSLVGYCEAEGAELLVSAFYYNKNGFQNGKREEAWFDGRVKPYMFNESLQLAEGLVFCGELNILPTAKAPLTGLHNYTAELSAIIPHAKLQLVSVPTPKDDDAKLLYTTGTITKRNYKQQRAGQIAEHHHAFAALVVEVDGDGDWFVRQLNCESGTGNFYDLDKYYTPQGITSGHTLEAVNYGDLHVSGISPDAIYACWGKRNPENILDTLKPKYQMLNDVFSNDFRNHHEIKNSLYLFKQFSRQQESVRHEVLATTKILESLDRDFSQRVVVDSNHDRSLHRFLVEQDYKKDPVNAVFMLEMTLDMYKAVEEGKPFHTFEAACRKVNPNMESVRFLRMDEKFTLCGNIVASNHGDLGANGSRPSLAGFAKLGVRHNIGHMHQISILDGVYCAGSCMNTGDANYTKGASSWSISHILTYKNGKRTIVTQKGKKWKGK